MSKFDDYMKDVVAQMLEARREVRWAGSVAVEILTRKYPDSEQGATYRETQICNFSELPRLVFKYLDAPVVLKAYLFDMRLKDKDPEYLGEPLPLDDFYDMCSLAKERLETQATEQEKNAGNKQIEGGGTGDAGAQGGQSRIRDVSDMYGNGR